MYDASAGARGRGDNKSRYRTWNFFEEHFGTLPTEVFRTVPEVFPASTTSEQTCSANASETLPLHFGTLRVTPSFRAMSSANVVLAAYSLIQKS